jgi:hypothetical protein
VNLSKGSKRSNLKVRPQKVEKDEHRQLSGVHDLKKVKEVVGLGYWVKLLGFYD